MQKDQTMVPAPECTFCSKFGKAGKALDWFDRALAHEEDSWVLVPGVGSFEEGYVIMLPREHHPTLASLPPNLWRQSSVFLARVLRTVRAAYGPLFVFEHGSYPDGNRAGSCIDHAHLHIVPTAAQLLLEIEADLDLIPLASYRDLRAPAFQHSSYLYIRDQDGRHYGALAPNLPSQYVRRVLARVLGRPHEWDYAAFPNYEVVRQTIKHLSRAFPNSS